MSILLNVTHGPTISKWTHIETCHKENFSEQSIAEIASQIHKTSPSTFAIWSFVKPINYILWEQTKQNPNFDFCLAKALCYLFKSHSLLTNPILHFAIAPQSDCEIRWLDMSSWGSKKAFAISLCLATVPTSVPGNQKTLDVGLFLKVLNKDPNIWLCVNKGWCKQQQAIISFQRSIALPQRAYTIYCASNEFALQRTRLNVYVDCIIIWNTSKCPSAEAN